METPATECREQNQVPHSGPFGTLNQLKRYASIRRFKVRR
jgi:hypothetical protein